MLESLDKNDPAKAEALKQSTHVDSVLKLPTILVYMADGSRML